jgi:hypothetical protein
MTISKKQLAGVTAVVLTVAYTLRRWRGNSPTVNDTEFDAEQTSGAD